MPDWLNYLTKQERARLETIEAARDALTAERMTLYQRAKKRRQRS